MKLAQMQKFFADHIRYKDYEFHIKEKNGVPYLQIQFMGTDNFSGDAVAERQYCRKWQLSEWMTKTELVRTAFLAVVQAERHELEENFTYMGSAVFNSHISIDKLREVACDSYNYEHRPEPIKETDRRVIELQDAAVEHKAVIVTAQQSTRPDYPCALEITPFLSQNVFAYHKANIEWRTTPRVILKKITKAEFIDAKNTIRVYGVFTHSHDGDFESNFQIPS